MPFQWKKKTNRVPASPERMEKAVKEVVQGCKLRTTATKYNIDKMTLRRYVVKFKEKGNTNFSPNFKHSQIFNSLEEKRMSKYLLDAARMNYGLTSKETRKLAYMYAVENKKENIPMNWNIKKTASYEWLRGFMLRNKDLSLRTPEKTSLSRATAFNKHTVWELYDLFREVFTRYEFGPDAIYNCDETGVQTVHKPSKIISQKGQKQVSKATSGERGQTVTVCCAINATGNSVPPFFIFPRVRVQDYMTNAAPPGSKAVTHPSGWMTSENFEIYLLHLINFVKCSKDNKILLILDNHSSHISPKGLSLCKDNGIILLTIPPHTSHRLQPLDVSVYGPFKTYFNQACDDFMVNHPGQTITLKDMAGLVGKAHPRAFTPMNIMKGFSKTGIYPFDAHIFSDQDFLSSSVTDRPAPSRREHTPDPASNIDHHPEASRKENTAQKSPIRERTPELATNEPQPGPSRQFLVRERTPELQPGPSRECSVREATPEPLPGLSGFHKTPEDIRPLPKAPPRKKQTCGRKSVKTKILTDTPNMKEINDDFINRLLKNKKKVNQVKRNISSDNATNACKKQKKVEKKKPEIISEDESESASDNVSIATSDEITDVEDQIENEIEEENFFQGVINVDDYVLVQFRSNKSVKHYVGKVLEIVEGGECRINFMRRKIPAYHFVYPDVPDESYVPLTDMIKLPPPCFVGGTARAERKLAFSVKFNKYDNVN